MFLNSLPILKKGFDPLVFEKLNTITYCLSKSTPQLNKRTIFTVKDFGGMYNFSKKGVICCK